MLAKAFSAEVVPYCLRSGMLSGGAAPWVALSTFLVVMGAALMYSPPIRRALLTLAQLLVMARRYLSRRLAGEAQLAGPVELRELFVRLGPTYIKFGQLIASSNGLFPERYVREFQKCLDRVPPEPWAVVKQTLTQALGRPPEQVFASIEEQPLASASIAQVYAVTVTDGGVTHDLVVKVQRRNLPELVAADMSMLAFCAEVLALLPGVRAMNPQAVVAQFQQSIREELDFLGEASRMEEFNRIMAELGRPDVVAPRPYRPLCHRRAGTNRHQSRADRIEADRRNACVVFVHAPLWLFSRRRSRWQFDGAARRTTRVFGLRNHRTTRSSATQADRELSARLCDAGLSSAGQDDGGDGRGGA